MNRFFQFLFVALLTVGGAAVAQQPVAASMRQAALTFLKSLTDEQRKTATFAFTDEERYNWHFVPRARKGLPFRDMTDAQHQAALTLLQTGLSSQGYGKVTSIFDLENVLIVVENRAPTDHFRDPNQYAFSVFGDPAGKDPWAWRMEGHHCYLHFYVLGDRVVAMTPTFLGSNPGVVRAEVPQKGKEVLKQETELAFALVNSLSDDQLKKATLSDVAPGEIVTFNKRKALLEKQEGIPFADLGRDQQRAFLDLLTVYLQRYHLTLANQQMDKLKQVGLDKLTFAWAGDRQPGYGPGKGQYYRIHGPTLLIEYDNTQNQGNHVHTIVRDLTNDFGEDVLAEHYRQQHR
jgi:hypothetical protein